MQTSRTRLLLATATLCLVLTSSSPSDAKPLSGPELRDNPELISFGVTEMDVEEVGRNERFVLYGERGLILGEAVVVKPLPERVAISFTDWAGDQFKFTWNAERGLIELTSPDGRVGISKFDLQGLRWAPDGVFEQLAAEHEGTYLAMAALGLNEPTDESSPRLQLEAVSKSTCEAPETNRKNLGTGVTCSWTPTQRGWGTFGPRSNCCHKATSDVNHDCTNTWCYGCCELLACDAYCGFGDFGCFCSRQGMECVGPLFE